MTRPSLAKPLRLARLPSHLMFPRGNCIQTIIDLAKLAAISFAVCATGTAIGVGLCILLVKFWKF
jgi:hypothetical protein